MEEIFNQLDGIKGTIQRLQGVPVTEDNVKIILAIINTTDLLKQEIQKAMAEKIVKSDGPEFVPFTIPETKSEGADEA